MAAYTRGGDRLHMCYTFDLLGPKFSAAHVRGCVEAFEAAVADGWVCWAFSNHDVVRHVSRWTPPGGDTDAVARFSIALLACLRGSICLYQGEELGLTEADIAFEDLRDPFGIRFWPGFKGRDGSRTPMPWEAEAENAGFSTAKPWLPIPPEHRARAVDVEEAMPHSVLARYREVLAFRKRHPALRHGLDRLPRRAGERVWPSVREADGERLFCAFNFGGRAVEWPLPPGIGTLEMLLDGEGRTVHGTLDAGRRSACFVGRPLG